MNEFSTCNQIDTCPSTLRERLTDRYISLTISLATAAAQLLAPNEETGVIQVTATAQSRWPRLADALIYTLGVKDRWSPSTAIYTSVPALAAGTTIAAALITEDVSAQGLPDPTYWEDQCETIELANPLYLPQAGDIINFEGHNFPYQITEKGIRVFTSDYMHNATIYCDTPIDADDIQSQFKQLIADPANTSDTSTPPDATSTPIPPSTPMPEYPIKPTATQDVEQVQSITVTPVPLEKGQEDTTREPEDNSIRNTLLAGFLAAVSMVGFRTYLRTTVFTNNMRGVQGTDLLHGEDIDVHGFSNDELTQAKRMAEKRHKTMPDDYCSIDYLPYIISRRSIWTKFKAFIAGK